MTLTDEQVLTERNDLEMLKRPHLWPSVLRGHICVFLRRGEFGGAMHTGPCFKTASGYVVLDHDWTANTAPVPVSVFYNSAEAVLADGWEVD